MLTHVRYLAGSVANRPKSGAAAGQASSQPPKTAFNKAVIFWKTTWGLSRVISRARRGSPETTSAAVGPPIEIFCLFIGVTQAAATEAAAHRSPLAARCRIRGTSRRHCYWGSGCGQRRASSHQLTVVSVPSLYGHDGVHHPPESIAAEPRYRSEGKRSDLQPGCNQFRNPS